MNSMDDGSEKTAELRSRAEEIIQENGAGSPGDLTTLSPEETRQMIHELRVHQIELTMQHEELLRAQKELDTTRARYFDLYNLAPVGYLIVSREGLILETNLAAVSLLGLARAVLIKQPLTRFILEEDLNIYYQHRLQLWKTGTPDACDLRLVRNDGTAFWARLTTAVSQDPVTRSGHNSGSAPVARVVLSDIADRMEPKKEQIALARRAEGEKTAQSTNDDNHRRKTSRGHHEK